MAPASKPDKQALCRYHCLVRGYVQGVGFRYFAAMEAVKRRLTGDVHNRDDGSVELTVQGSRAQLEDFLEAILVGNGFMEVEAIEREEVPYDPNEGSFSIEGYPLRWQ